MHHRPPEGNPSTLKCNTPNLHDRANNAGWSRFFLAAELMTLTSEWHWCLIGAENLLRLQFNCMLIADMNTCLDTDFPIRSGSS